MVEYDVLYNDVKNMLSEKRFIHTEGVIERAIQYALVYGVDVEKAKFAALAHDIAKEIPKEESYKLLKEYGIELNEIEQRNSKTIHSKLGAAIAKNKYGLSDDIVDAIKYHTTGRPNMTMLEKIIYLADTTEKNRKYDSKHDDLTLEELVNLIKEDIDKGLDYVLTWTLKSILDRNMPIHLNTVEAYNFYKKD